MDFMKFKIAVAVQFEKMRKHGLLRTTAPKDLLWDTYLNSFPEGTNPIYRERREYDCNCCKHKGQQSFTSSAGPFLVCTL